MKREWDLRTSTWFLEHALQAKCPYFKKDLFHLERIQRAAKVGKTLIMKKNLKHLNYSTKKRIRKDLVLTHKIIYTTKLTSKQLNCSSSPEGQAKEGHHLDFFNIQACMPTF